MVYMVGVISNRKLLSCCKLRNDNRLEKSLNLSHNPEVAGSNPAPAIDVSQEEAACYVLLLFCAFGGL